MNQLVIPEYLPQMIRQQVPDDRKLVEESPAPGLLAHFIDEMGSASVPAGCWPPLFSADGHGHVAAAGPGIVLVSMAAAIALGAASMSDIAVLAHLVPVPGGAPSGAPGAGPALDLGGTPAVLD